jgi:hypothetical protein
MMAILAAICFALQFVLRLMGEAIPHVDLVALGLFLLALSFVAIPVRIGRG